MRCKIKDDPNFTVNSDLYVFFWCIELTHISSILSLAVHCVMIRAEKHEGKKDKHTEKSSSMLQVNFLIFIRLDFSMFFLHCRQASTDDHHIDATELTHTHSRRWAMLILNFPSCFPLIVVVVSPSPTPSLRLFFFLSRCEEKSEIEKITQLS